MIIDWQSNNYTKLKLKIVNYIDKHFFLRFFLLIKCIRVKYLYIGTKYPSILMNNKLRYTQCTPSIKHL